MKSRKKKSKNPILLISTLIITVAVIITVAAFYTFKPAQEVYSCPDCNVILIVIDTLRADHVSAYGYYRETTPNIDKLAQEGILFKNTISPASWTRPATATILTGLYPKNHGISEQEDKLSDSVTMFSEILKQEGYATYAFSASANVAPEMGFDQGYNEFNYFPGTIPDTTPDPKKLDVNTTKSDVINKAILPFLQELTSGENNFIYIHYMDPHAPYFPIEQNFSLTNKANLTELNWMPFYAPRFYNLYNSLSEIHKAEVLQEMINAYDDEILYNDKMVGQVIDKLIEKDMYNNSIIVIVSDYGEEFYERGGFEHGTSLYDEQIKVPFIIHLPEKINKVITKQSGLTDIMPTVLSILGIKAPDDIDGINLFDDSMEYYYSELDGVIMMRSVRSLKNKLMKGEVSGRIYNRFFLIDNDPEEKKNLYKHIHYQNIIKELEEDIKEYISTGREYPGSGINYTNQTLEQLKALGYIN